jgi:hypothetical protein
MASQYELGYLSNLVYNMSQSDTGSHEYNYCGFKDKHIFQIKNNDWQYISGSGIGTKAYAATYLKRKTGEHVHAFRGTRFELSNGNLRDMYNNLAHHLTGRSSPYISQAQAYFGRYNLKNSIITGHSLGGFIAVSMAFFYPNLKIASFNAPVVVSAITENIKILFNNNFKTCKILAFESTNDGASIATKAIRNSVFPKIVDSLIKSNYTQMKHVPISNGGLHGIKDLLEKLSDEEITWR